jgi:2,2-dialkylglycine decarboxylase (pyruvate)
MSVLAETGLDPAFWSDVDRHVVRYTQSWVPAIVERAEGSTLFTSDGREILDFTSGQMSSILGHSHPAITATVREAMGTCSAACSRGPSSSSRGGSPRASRRR